MLITLAIAIIPTIVLCYFVYKKDVLEKEPAKLLVTLFLFGVGSTVPAAFLEQFLLMFVNTKSPNYLDIFITSFLCIALVEEGYKFLFTYIITWKNRNFNQLYDGIVYAVFMSLGFATLENIMYVFQYGTNVGILRALVSVPGHAFFGVTMGYYLGFAKYYKKNNDKPKFKKNIFLGILMPVIFHGLFDFLLLTGNEIMVLVFFVFVLVLYIVSYLKIKKLSKVMSLIDN